MWDEPARGGFPEPGFGSLPGIDQARAYLRRLIPRPPLSHLQGIRVTQVGHGTATCTMPASPWLQSSNGSLDATALIEVALSTAVLTTVPPGTDVRTAGLSFTHFRPAALESETLIARARTVSSGATFTFAEVLVEDALGREVLRASGVSLVQPTEPPPPPPAMPDAPIDEPRYPSPDPPRRPLPPGIGIVPPYEWARLDGPTLAAKIISGDLPKPPVIALLGVRRLEIEQRRSLIALPANDWLCWRSRDRISPAAVAALVYRALVTSAYSEVRGPQRVGTLDVNISLLADVANDGEELVAEGRVTDREGDFIFATATLTDARGRRLAIGHHSMLLLGPGRRLAAPPRTAVVTVLFTDLVASTTTAKELGDARWQELLDQHHSLVRRQLEISNGHEVKTTGDGFLATFDSPADALRCARGIRTAIANLGLEVRVGIHTGQCEVSDGDVAGIAVHVAARVLSAAGPGEVLVSGTVRDLVLGSDSKFDDRGRHQLKGIDGDWQLFALAE